MRNMKIGCKKGKNEMIMNVTASTEKIKELMLKECPDYYSLSDVRKTISILKFVKECDAETMFKYMDETEIFHAINADERVQQLKSLVDRLNLKYPTDHQSSSHYAYKVKPVDIKEIVSDYINVLLDSNLYVSPATNAHQGYSYAEFEVYATDIYFGLKSKKWNNKTHFDVAVRMDEADEIKVVISCGTILSFEFFYSKTERYDQISFRND
jgi:hypothetical protein